MINILHSNNGDGLFHGLWRNINLIVGNSKRFNCKQKGYRMKMTLTVMTLYILMFTVGLFAGDLAVSKVIELERLLGFISTALVYSMGFSVIYDCFTRKCGYLASIVSGITVLTQTAFVFNLFPIEYTNMLYYIASVATMSFVYGYVNKDKLSNAPTST